ncbi:calcium-binding protein [Nitratireductor mangrovi]|uniref:Calcium-binding protein n=1 Tax=Nitratireductor mangrovi TaxID=2599600 RepID=A0A6H0DXW6_9HYPH|nr:calcium-binding protein [Nitratireductor mangrovi]QIS94638.1 calcium-binding protein [Nitratireductor mangrovi]
MVSTPNFTDGTWQIASTLHINGAPFGDILWQNIADQSLVLWQQDGTSTVATDILPSVSDHEVAVVGDFDGDGRADPYLRDQAVGTNKVLLSSTGAITNSASASSIADARAATDLNGDGMDDVIYFINTNANLLIFEMDGASVPGTSSFASGYTTDDTLLAAFDGTDFDTFKSLWFDDSTFQFDITSYSGGVRTVTDTFTVNAGNEFVMSGDFNGDGDPDFLYRDAAGSDTGSIEVVFTNGSTEIGRAIYEVPTFANVQFENAGDFDNDGIVELVMRDPVSGELTLMQAMPGTVSSQTLTGSDTNDLIDGGDGNDDLFGRGGDDLIFGGDDNDFIMAGDGDDRADGGIGGDSIFGGSGNDELLGNTGNDQIIGGAGNDTLIAGNGTDVLDGGEGNDFLRAGSFGFDHMRGGAGDDVIESINDRSVQEGQDGDDVLFGGSSLDVLFGGNGNDLLIGNLSLDTIFGGAGDDIIIGVDVEGSSGTDDVAYGGSGTDFFYLGSDDTNYYTGGGELTIKDFSTSTTTGDFLMLNGTSGNYNFVDQGATIEVQQASDSDVLAIIETAASAASVEAKAIYLG